MGYIDDFGKHDDYCLVAESDGKIIGAVWVRILNGEVKGYGNIDDKTPEFAISVKKQYQRQGIGTSLMQEMIQVLADNEYSKVSLSVAKNNYAMGMYRKLGFMVIEERDEDYLMLLQLH